MHDLKIVCFSSNTLIAIQIILFYQQNKIDLIIW